jgi:anti-sigma-K factor RskA
MTDEQKELLYDLLVKRVTEGLDAKEQKQLDTFDHATVEAEYRALETVAAAIGMASIDIEPMPQHLFASIAAAAPATIKSKEAEFDGGATIPSMARVYTAEDVFVRRPRTWIFGMLGWAAAVVLLVILGVQFYSDRRANQPEKAAVTPQPAPSPGVTVAEQRDELLRSAPDVVSATWAPGNMKDMQVSGDIVWSDSRQAGYIRLHGLPPNDTAKASYQLWIFDKAQDKPIDGGVFDVSSNGELVLPVNAKLHAVKPGMFAITVEKPGGVVESKKDKIATLAKVETQKS